MRCILDQPQKEICRLQNVFKNLQDAVGLAGRHNVIDDLSIRRGYAHYDFEGTVRKEFVDALGRNPTEEEIIMYVDGGFSHFGAECYLSDNGFFRGRVNTD